MLPTLTWLPLVPTELAFAAGEGRATAQTVGISDSTSSAIPGLVWGGNRRCDPTDIACTQGGRLTDGLWKQTAQPLPSKPYETSERVILELSLSGQPAGSIEVGLWRDQAPGSVDTFVKLAQGRLAPSSGDSPASFDRSSLIRIAKDKAIVLGALRQVFAQHSKSNPQSREMAFSTLLVLLHALTVIARHGIGDTFLLVIQVGGQTQLVRGQTRPVMIPVAPPLNKDSNLVRHDAAGLLSVRRGGGSFAFTITPRPNLDLDRDEIVIGQVLTSEGMELLERLNGLATNNYNRGSLARVIVERARVLPPN